MNGPTPARRARAQLWILIAVFFAPLLIAFLLYYGGAGWRPAGRTNHGELIEPARPLPDLELPSMNGERLAFDFQSGKWSLVYIGSGDCDQRCREALTLMRQTRLALNENMTRVQRVFLATGECCDRGYLDDQHPGLIVARADSPEGASLVENFPGAAHGGSGRIYIVDPLGNLMMSHTPEVPHKGLLEDLARLLKLSHIG
ncbi:MAG: hypothetical protein RBS02_09435 [Steroidobacteraceae bacterium]|jgi:hypothetical protein|nr:hypothetical protein [Steroidobacteraceae bacterium]